MRKTKKLRRPPAGPFDSAARSRLSPHPYVNEIWATLDCWHPCFFRFPVYDRVAMLRCCECGIVLYPKKTPDGAVCYAIGPAL